MSMQRHVAFLRGINVGGHVVKMERLRTLFEALELTNVSTFIASGNVLFESASENAAALESRIERHLRESLGYEVATFLRTPTELAAVANHNPVGDTDRDEEGTSQYVLFLKRAPTEETRQRIVALGTKTDVFHCREREVYWFCRTKISESPLFSGTLLGKTIGEPGTMRNMTTVRKLAARI